MMKAVSVITAPAALVGYVLITSWLLQLERTANVEGLMNTSSTLRPVEMKLIGKHLRRPPLVELIFDVALHNDRAEPRWFILPTKLNLGSGLFDGGVDRIEVSEFSGKGHVVLGCFKGAGGFQTLLLPPNARVRIRGLVISYWGKLPEDTSIDAVIAKQITVGGEPSQVWFKTDPLCDAEADVTQDQGKKISVTHTPDDKEVPVSVQEDFRVKLRVALTESKPQ